MSSRASSRSGSRGRASASAGGCGRFEPLLKPESLPPPSAREVLRKVPWDAVRSLRTGESVHLHDSVTEEVVTEVTVGDAHALPLLGLSLAQRERGLGAASFPRTPDASVSPEQLLTHRGSPTLSPWERTQRFVPPSPDSPVGYEEITLTRKLRGADITEDQINELIGSGAPDSKSTCWSGCPSSGSNSSRRTGAYTRTY